MRILFSALIASLAVAVQADGIYKWVDEDGIVHFGSQPPQAEQVKVIKRPTSKHYNQWQSKQDALSAQRLAAKAKPKVEEKVEAKVETAPPPISEPSPTELAVRAQRCRHAQQTLNELQTNARVREMDADGNQRILTEQEHQQRIHRMQQVIGNNC